LIEGSIGCGRRALYETGMDRNTGLWVACSVNDDGTKRRSCLATQLVSARGMSERAENRQRPVVRSRRAGVGVRRELRVTVDLSVVDEALMNGGELTWAKVEGERRSWV
jgi:hypothetical protein